MDFIRGTHVNNAAKFSDQPHGINPADIRVLQKLNDVFYISEEPRLK